MTTKTHKILKFFSWKKWMIATIIITINGYLAIKWLYWDAEYLLISTIIWALFQSASIATKNIYKQ